MAAQFQRNIATASKRVGTAVVDDLLTELNHETIRRERLAPGVKVKNKHDPFEREWVISSISGDGTVFFRGGNGAESMGAEPVPHRGLNLRLRVTRPIQDFATCEGA